MVERVVCPKCNRASYTTAPEVFGPCPYCGFIFNWRSPDRRIFSRTKKAIPLTLEKDGTSYTGRTIDFCKRGLAVVTYTTSFLKEGDEVSCLFRDEEEDKKNTRVVWTKEESGKQLAGLLFV